MDEVEKLKAENDALRKRMEKLEEQVNPKPFKSDWKGPVDYTANASMPPSAVKSMIDAVPDALMKELRADTRRPNPVTEASSSPLRSTPSVLSQPQKRGTGWRDEVPLRPQPGIEHVDRLVDAQDEIDRAELALNFAKARMGKGETK